MFGTTPAGLCQEWAKETLRHRQMDSVGQGVPADALLSTQAGGTLPAVKGASKAKPAALRAKAQLSPKATPPAEQVVPDAPLPPIAAKPDLPERGPRASATLHQEAVTLPVPENRWDSAKVAIPVPYIRMTVPSSAAQRNDAPKTPAPDASVNPSPGRSMSGTTAAPSRGNGDAAGLEQRASNWTRTVALNFLNRSTFLRLIDSD